MSRVDYRFSDKRHYIITSFCSPIDDINTRVFTAISFKYGLISPLVRLVFEPLARVIIQQDVSTLNKQYANIAKFGSAHFLETPQDLLYRQIVSWRERIRKGEKGGPLLEARDIELHV
jgi:hypothetical protein